MVEVSRLSWWNRLAPVEHLLIGSTPKVKERIVNVLDDLQEVRRSGDVGTRRTLLTPIFLQEYQSFEEARAFVLRERQKAREEQAIKGAISALGTNGIIIALRRGISVCLELSDLDDSGFIQPAWKIYLVDKTGVVINDGEIMKSQQIHDRLRSEFILGEMQTEQRKHGPLLYRMISLNQ